jgi:hypothetical protein
MYVELTRNIHFRFGIHYFSFASLEENITKQMIEIDYTRGSQTVGRAPLRDADDPLRESEFFYKGHLF